MRVLVLKQRKKQANAAAADGVIKTRTDGNHGIILLEVNCQTDFAAAKDAGFPVRSQTKFWTQLLLAKSLTLKF